MQVNGKSNFLCCTGMTSIISWDLLFRNSSDIKHHHDGMAQNWSRTISIIQPTLLHLYTKKLYTVYMKSIFLFTFTGIKRRYINFTNISSWTTDAINRLISNTMVGWRNKENLEQQPRILRNWVRSMPLYVRWPVWSILDQRCLQAAVLSQGSPARFGGTPWCWLDTWPAAAHRRRSASCSVSPWGTG